MNPSLANESPDGVEVEEAGDEQPDAQHSEPHEFTIHESGQRLDAFLAASLGVSRARAQSIIETALVNGAAAKPSHKLKTGDVIVLAPAVEALATSIPAETCETALPPIIYEDDALLVINKPRGLVVHPGAGQESGTLVDILRAHGRALSGVGPPERAGIVHRLDKDTSGLMVVCKTDEAHWKLAADFAERRVQKNYAALVCGVPPTRGRIEAPIARHPRDRKKMAIGREGRPSVTEYTVEKSWTKFALLNVNLLTGRTHQIRVHLAHIGHPVAGDEVYSGAKRALQSAPNDEVRAALQHLAGQALHAAHLEFTHPILGVRLQFDAPLSDDMKAVIESLG